MCGIAATFQLGSQPSVGKSRMPDALNCLAHRGPDDEGQYQQGRAILGHRRLSILDTSAAGHQPFTDSGGRYTIAFNGEVFNFQELRAQLESAGHAFRSHTDTEVVLRLFTIKGPDFLHDLNGFFALAIHDAQEDRLFVARDRFGVKPLYWAEQQGQLMVASELRALLALGVERKLDRCSVEQLLLHQFIPAPSTALLGVRKLAPGHCLEADADGVRHSRWYSLPTASIRPTAKPANRLMELLEDAVRIRLVADVPVGTFLSGGVDSSIVTALAARHKPDLHTFSIGYAEDPYYDESAHAETVARHLGTEHHSFRLERAELAEAYTRLLAATDEPFSDSSALPSFILCERTRKHVTVALSGDGADELFGGYRKHQAELRWARPGAAERTIRALGPLWRSLPRSRRSPWQDRIRQFDRFARLARLPAGQRTLELTTFTDRSLVEQLWGTMPEERQLRERALLSEEGSWTGLDRVLYHDLLFTLPNQMLHKVDLTSMAHALEVRTPFLDKRVVELAFALPAAEKLRKGSGKHLLRTTFGHLLPPEVMQRSKKGFEVPLLDLYNTVLRADVDQWLHPDRVEAAGLSAAAVNALIARSRSADPGTAEATLHACIVYTTWWERHLGPAVAARA
jgi:asparagine synthase (glutamine-hydrolysing)